MSARSDDRAWYKNVSVPLYNQVRGNVDTGDEIGVVVRWTPPDIQMPEMEEAAITELHRKLASGFWFSEPQNQNKPDWVGLAIAGTIGIDISKPNWKAKAKASLRQLVESGAVRIVKERNGSSRKDVKVARPPEDFDPGCAGCASPAQV